MKLDSSLEPLVEMEDSMMPSLLALQASAIDGDSWPEADSKSFGVVCPRK